MGPEEGPCSWGWEARWERLAGVLWPGCVAYTPSFGKDESREMIALLLSQLDTCFLAWPYFLCYLSSDKHQPLQRCGQADLGCDQTALPIICQLSLQFPPQWGVHEVMRRRDVYLAKQRCDLSRPTLHTIDCSSSTQQQSPGAPGCCP